MSLRARNLSGSTLKVNDKRGNPVEIGAVVVWRVRDSAQAAFDVDDCETYVGVQAEAIVGARHKIVQGAVSMVEAALQALSERQVVELDEERRAAMVSNLLVVLCSDRDAQPVINAGTLYG